MGLEEVFRSKRTLILKATGGPLETNSYFIVRDLTLRVLVDPFSPEILQILHKLKAYEEICFHDELAVIFTHLHPDHVSYLIPYLSPIKFSYMCHPADLNLRYVFAALGESIGIETYYPSEDIEPVIGSDLLKDLSLEIRHTPGHSPGSISLILREEPLEVAIVGDLIFKGAIGRWDLPGGDLSALKVSIRDLLSGLRKDALILPGHGPVTTLRDELEGNPFIMEIMGMAF